MSLLQWSINRHDLCSLTGLRWLNDQVCTDKRKSQALKPFQVIQVYLSLVVERSNCATFRELHMPKVKMPSIKILFLRLCSIMYLLGAGHVHVHLSEHYEEVKGTCCCCKVGTWMKSNGYV